jgi:hypothetical protein
MRDKVSRGRLVGGRIIKAPRAPPGVPIKYVRSPPYTAPNSRGPSVCVHAALCSRIIVLVYKIPGYMWQNY